MIPIIVINLIQPRFWYKRLITRLDTGALNEVFTPNTSRENEMKEERDISLDYSFETEKSDISNIKENKSISIHGTNKIDTEKGDAWKKLMNLLIQLRKVCNQYISFLFSY